MDTLQYSQGVMNMSRIRELRKEKELSQEELGKLLNVQKAAISKYERGTIEPSKSVLLKMSEIFDVPTDYLLGVTNNKDKTTNHAKIDLSEEEILTLAAHKVGHDGPLSDMDMSMIKKAIKIALDK